MTVLGIALAGNGLLGVRESLPLSRSHLLDSVSNLAVDIQTWRVSGDTAGHQRHSGVGTDHRVVHDSLLRAVHERAADWGGQWRVMLMRRVVPLNKTTQLSQSTPKHDARRSYLTAWSGEYRLGALTQLGLLCSITPLRITDRRVECRPAQGHPVHSGHCTGW